MCVLKPRGSLFILHVKGISGKCKRIGNRYNIRRVFKTKHAFTPSLVITRPKEGPQFCLQYYTCIWQELRQSNRQITQSLDMCLWEHRQKNRNWARMLVKRTIDWVGMKPGIFKMENNSRCRKYKDLTNIVMWRITSSDLFFYVNIYLFIYTGCPRRNVPDFGRVFLMLKYTDITQKHLCPKLNGYGDNGQRSLKLWQLLHTCWLPNTY